MKYEHNFYRTKDGSLDIEFLFLDLGKELGWRGYVLSDINYKAVSSSRSDNYTDTHLYLDNGTNRYIDAEKDYPYICWTQTIHNLDTMHRLAEIFSEITAYYIKHGGSFESIQKKLEKEGII